jgi:hypothetical protein
MVGRPVGTELESTWKDVVVAYRNVILVFAWRDWGKQGNVIVRTTVLHEMWPSCFGGKVHFEMKNTVITSQQMKCLVFLELEWSESAVTHYLTARNSTLYIGIYARDETLRYLSLNQRCRCKKKCIAVRRDCACSWQRHSHMLPFHNCIYPPSLWSSSQWQKKGTNCLQKHCIS